MSFAYSKRTFLFSIISGRQCVWILSMGHECIMSNSNMQPLTLSEQTLFSVCSPWEFVFHVLSLLQCLQLSAVYILRQVPQVLVSARLATSLKTFLDQYSLFLADRLSLLSLIRSILKPTPGSLQMYSPPLSKASQKLSHLLTEHVPQTTQDTSPSQSCSWG